ncbi:hypothetical protein ACP70R_035047 [Stipagrostis hirtigluma subsp. patula]
MQIFAYRRLQSFGIISLLFSGYTISLLGRVFGEQRGGAAEIVSRIGVEHEKAGSMRAAHDLDGEVVMRAGQGRKHGRYYLGDSVIDTAATPSLSQIRARTTSAGPSIRTRPTATQLETQALQARLDEETRRREELEARMAQIQAEQQVQIQQQMSQFYAYMSSQFAQLGHTVPPMPGFAPPPSMSPNLPPSAASNDDPVRGLSAGLLRQAAYTAARLGSFRVLTNKAVEKNEGKPLPLTQKAFIGLTSGAIGACVSSPADLALIRMQADSTLPAAQRRNYKNAFHALYRITADEGVLALWKGAGPTVVRAMALNMGMLASYDQSAELFRDKFDAGEVSTVLGASAVSGFFASACSLPFDYVKTQIQKMQPDANGKYPYTGSLDCAVKTFKSGGTFKFYTGFPVYRVRIGPHVMMTWIFLSHIQRFQKKIGI